MNLKSLGAAVSLAAAAAQASVDLADTTPFASGFNAVAVIDEDAGAGAFVAKIQTSPDNVTWTDVLTKNGAGPISMAQVTLDRYVRLNVTSAGSAGTANAYLLV